MFRVVQNTGIAFSIPIEGLILKVLTIALICIIGIYFLKYEKFRYNVNIQMAYTLILSGAISNGIERVFVGSVTDFIVVKYFAIFNFADIFISTGTMFLFGFYLFYEHNNRKSH